MSQQQLMQVGAPAYRPSRSGRLWRWSRERAWRYRSELAPLSAGAVLLAGATTLHLTGPQWWWTALPAGAVLVGTAATWTIHPRRNRPVRRRAWESRWIAGEGLLAVAWLAAAWRSGPAVLPLWAFGIAVVLAGCPWWWHRRRRSKVCREYDNFPSHAQAAKLPRLEAQSAGYNDHSYWFDCLLNGHTLDEVRRHLRRLSGRLRARPGSVTVEAHPRDDGRCRIVVDETEPEEPTWRHMGQEVERVGRERVRVEPVPPPRAPVGGGAWRPRLVDAGEAEPVVVEAPRRLVAPAPSDPLLDVLGAVGPAGIGYKALAEQTGIPTATLTRRLRRLREAGEATSEGGSWRAAKSREEGAS